MNNTEKRISKPQNYFLATIQCKCPRCREGKLFINSNPYKLGGTLKMNHECLVCGQPTEIEVGFYTGAAYVAYALTVALAVSVFVAWYVLIGFTLQIGDNRIFECLGTAILAIVVMVPILMRLSRSVWLSFFVRYDKDWRINKPEHFERINPIGMEASRDL